MRGGERKREKDRDRTERQIYERLKGEGIERSVRGMREKASLGVLKSCFDTITDIKRKEEGERGRRVWVGGGRERKREG